MTVIDNNTKRVNEEAALFHDVMSCLRKMKIPHGKCEPRTDRACAHCNGADDLQEIVRNYKGHRVILA